MGQKLNIYEKPPFKLLEGKHIVFTTHAYGLCWKTNYRLGYAFKAEWYRCGVFQGDGCDSGVWFKDMIESTYAKWEEE